MALLRKITCNSRLATSLCHPLSCIYTLSLQCVAVWYSVLQCVAVCCSVVQCVAVCCSVVQCVAVCRSVLQCVAASNMDAAFFPSCQHHCNTLPHTATHATHPNTPHYTSTHPNTLQLFNIFAYTATRLLTLHNTATQVYWRYDILQHTATHGNTQ